MNEIALQVVLDSNTIHLDNVQRIFSKKAMITVVEMPVQNFEDKPK